MERTVQTSEPWRVGVLFSCTGFLSVIEATQLQGTLLAIDEINASGGLHGRPIEPVIYDPGSETAAFGLLAKRLMVEHGIRTIFGCYTSSSRKAVIPVVERLNGLLWYPTIYEGFEYSQNVIYTGAAPNQSTVELCRFLMENYGNRFYFVGSDYIYPHETNRIMKELVRHNGGSVVGESYVGLRARRPDFLPVLHDIADASPDVIFSTVVGEGTTYLYQGYLDAGFDSRKMSIASLTTTEAEIRSMGADVAEGHITAAPYFDGLGNPQSNRFEEGVRRRFGDDARTNMCLEAAYFQVQIFARAVEQTNSLETDILRPTVLRTHYDAPQGRVSINPTSAHTDLWTRIGRANALGRFEVLRESRSPVRADPYLVGYGRAFGCV